MRKSSLILCYVVTKQTISGKAEIKVEKTKKSQVYFKRINVKDMTESKFIIWNSKGF